MIKYVKRIMTEAKITSLSAQALATDHAIQILGVVTHADRVFFNPSLVQVEHV